MEIIYQQWMYCKCLSEVKRVKSHHLLVSGNLFMSNCVCTLKENMSELMR